MMHTQDIKGYSNQLHITKDKRVFGSRHSVFGVLESEFSLCCFSHRRDDSTTTVPLVLYTVVEKDLVALTV